MHCPGEVTIGPHCDAMYGHDARTVNVHVPLTAARGTSALVVERTVGAEDFVALEVGGCGGEAKVYNERHDWGRPGGGDSEGVGSTGVRGGAADTARQG